MTLKSGRGVVARTAGRSARWMRINSKDGSQFTARNAVITRLTICVIDEIAHIIPTIGRPRVAQRLINSILRFYPAARVYVCDDSEDPRDYEGAVSVPATAYDIGLSAKRNRLVQVTDEPYIFVWDDDYICTKNTDLRVFYDLLRSLEDVGIVGGEWTLGNGQREVWFTGTLNPKGTKLRLEHPTEPPQSAETGSGPVRYHRVDCVPNWFLAERETLTTCPWDEVLKLNEHMEFFARLSAIRAGSEETPSEEGRELRRRWKRLERGEALAESKGDDRKMIEARGTFRNGKELAHVGGMVRRGDWIPVRPGYADALIEKELAVPLDEAADTRPFPLPNPADDVPLGVAFTPDTTCRHHRHESRNERYNEKRFRPDTFLPLKREKLGITERKFVQWSSYPFGEPDFSDPDPETLELPTLNTVSHKGTPS